MKRRIVRVPVVVVAAAAAVRAAATLDLKMAWFYLIVPVSFAALVLVGIELVIRLVLSLLGAKSGIVMEGAMPAVVEN